MPTQRKCTRRAAWGVVKKSARDWKLFSLSGPPLAGFAVVPVLVGSLMDSPRSCLLHRKKTCPELSGTLCPLRGDPATLFQAR